MPSVLASSHTLEKCVLAQPDKVHCPAAASSPATHPLTMVASIVTDDINVQLKTFGRHMGQQACTAVQLQPSLL